MVKHTPLPYRRRAREVQMALGDTTAVYEFSGDSQRATSRLFIYYLWKKKKCLEHKALYSLYSVPPDITKTFTLQGGSGKAFATFIKISAERDVYWDFPGSSVVKTPSYQCRGYRFNPYLRK